MTRVVITGVGAVTPAGIGTDALWQRALSGRSCVRRIDRFDPASYRCQVAGQSDSFVARDWLPGRFIKRTDRFTHLAVVAAEMALRDAGLGIGGDSGVRPERAGVMVGNVLGGWDFAERELRDLWSQGVREVSPYQATAWFPAAPQGNICIRLGIKGRARTFVCDRASGAYALAHAAETILRGQADVVIAGGTEQPISPYAWLCCQTGNFLTSAGNSDPAAAYRPFDRGHGGTVVGEGSVFLVLERFEHAWERGARIRGELAGWALNNDGYMPYYTSEPHGATMAAAVARSLDRAGIRAGDLGCVVADGSAIPREDAAEVTALRSALRDHDGLIPVTSVKASYGHLLGSATPADVAVAVQAIKHGLVPPVANLRSPAPGFDLDFVAGAPRAVPGLRHVLVVSRGLGGANACLVVSGADADSDGGTAGAEAQSPPQTATAATSHQRNGG
ncbi:MAG: beta-ketoacyl-[acyl-carrier-protein] synthase family protein [Nocardiopsaceae bacterium]|jgi:3-oxoacyl-(acyl-carrier-protein) synthase|nr:beta-ketoacyl-[acyl-carrier-protein] synthase family protein [Nocardiopsaceae bacterium]